MAEIDEGRRAFLTAIASSGVMAGAAGRAKADHDPEEWPGFPDWVSFDKTRLEKYQPLTVIRHLDVDPSAVHGLIAEDPEQETDVYVYGYLYPTQKDPIGIRRTSHLGDHEWIYVFVNRASEEVEDSVSSIYHWLAGKDESPTLYEETHPQYHVHLGYHNSTPTTEEGVLVDPIEDLTDSFPSWLKNGMDEAINYETVRNPYVMADLEDWWKRDGFNTDRAIASIYAKAGLYESTAEGNSWF